MQTSASEITAFNFIITTVLLLLFGSTIVYFVFLYQRRRFRQQKDMLELRETFSQILLESKLEIREQTLDHIAKELHANFSHLVSVINMHLSEALPQSPPGIKEILLEAKSLTKQLLSEMKALNTSLNTDHIMHIGFLKAINNELNRFAKLKRYQTSFTKTGEEFRLPPENEIILFRLSQEVLNNVMNYAQASKVSVVIDYLEKSMVLQIVDNGIGFDVEKAYEQSSEKDSTGLLNMQKRARMIKADFSIVSGKGAGTTVKINIPR